MSQGVGGRLTTAGAVVLWVWPGFAAEGAVESKQPVREASSGATAVEEGQAEPSRETPRRNSLARVPSAKASSEGPPPPTFGTFEGTYLLMGLEGGMTFGLEAFVLGAEVSVARQTREFAWWGAYLDGVYDFGREEVRLSIGPELGWSALGLDAGYLLAMDGEGTHSGITVRPLLTMGYLSAYARVSHLFYGETWAEAGLLVKYLTDL